jgi:phage shock protein C
MVKKRLYRSRKEKIIGGVCGGLGEFFDVDPTIIRLLWAIMTILSVGAGIVAYLVAWIIIPERKKPESEKTNKRRKK